MLAWPFMEAEVEASVERGRELVSDLLEQELLFVFPSEPRPDLDQPALTPVVDMTTCCCLTVHSYNALLQSENSD